MGVDETTRYRRRRRRPSIARTHTEGSVNNTEHPPNHANTHHDQVVKVQQPLRRQLLLVVRVETAGARLLPGVAEGRVQVLGEGAYVVEGIGGLWSVTEEGEEEEAEESSPLFTSTRAGYPCTRRQTHPFPRNNNDPRPRTGALPQGDET